MEPLPNSWAEIQPDTIYQTTNGLLVSFSQAQIQLGIISNPVTSELFISLISLCVLCVLCG
ncbi:MAG: hypothetical protein EAZ78_24420 [Oscillatoriales cyanobacterium]|nr:MAG: hypothetical protein EAZ78_24420 [Oscillatoriales cyanobacterium]TAF62945.1 MAG: hypothetical protein EAZ59_21985 [Oscillatoriales cyanobacterium]